MNKFVNGNINVNEKRGKGRLSMENGEMIGKIKDGIQ
jgi:hypothetical protein